MKNRLERTGPKGYGVDGVLPQAALNEPYTLYWRSFFGRSARRILSVCMLFLPTTGYANVIDIQSFTNLAHRCGPTVATLTLAAVAETESRFESMAAFDNTNRRSWIFRTQSEAVSTVEHLIATGHSVDLGLMQINSANLYRLGMTLREAFDPCKSISAAAALLSNNYLRAQGSSTQQSALRDALSAYNTGSRRRGYRNGYVRKIETAAAKLISSGQVVPTSKVSREATADTASDNRPAEWWNVWGEGSRYSTLTSISNEPNSENPL